MQSIDLYQMYLSYSFLFWSKDCGYLGLKQGYHTFRVFGIRYEHWLHKTWQQQILSIPYLLGLCLKDVIFYFLQTTLNTDETYAILLYHWLRVLIDVQIRRRPRILELLQSMMLKGVAAISWMDVHSKFLCEYGVPWARLFFITYSLFVQYQLVKIESIPSIITPRSQFPISVCTVDSPKKWLVSGRSTIHIDINQACLLKQTHCSELLFNDVVD